MHGLHDVQYIAMAVQPSKACWYAWEMTDLKYAPPTLWFPAAHTFDVGLHCSARGWGHAAEPCTYKRSVLPCQMHIDLIKSARC
jgi:hypothetical protein